MTPLTQNTRVVDTKDHWRFNGASQIVNSEFAHEFAGWDSLANETIKMTSGGGSSCRDVRNTPPILSLDEYVHFVIDSGCCLNHISNSFSEVKEHPRSLQGEALRQFGRDEPHHAGNQQFHQQQRSQPRYREGRGANLVHVSSSLVAPFENYPSPQPDSQFYDFRTSDIALNQPPSPILDNPQMFYNASHGRYASVTRPPLRRTVYRATHYPCASDRSLIRDAATLALLNGHLEHYPGIPAHFVDSPAHRGLASDALPQHFPGKSSNKIKGSTTDLGSGGSEEWCNAVISRLSRVFATEVWYKQLLCCQGKEAQTLLDLFQMVGVILRAIF